MEYKPPVKTSLKKLYDGRLSSRGSTSHTRPSPGSRDVSRPRSPPNAAAAGATYAPPATGPASFERRMRAALFGVTERTRSKINLRADSTRRASPMANLVPIESLQEYKLVVGGEQERLVVVRFHATYCRACKAVTPYFYKMVKSHPGVLFVDVPVTAKTAVLHQGLGVPSLPFVHLYHPTAGLVEEQKMTRKEIGGFQQTLDCYISGTCILPQDEDPIEDP